MRGVQHVAKQAASTAFNMGISCCVVPRPGWGAKELDGFSGQPILVQTCRHDLFQFQESLAPVIGIFWLNIRMAPF